MNTYHLNLIYLIKFGFISQDERKKLGEMTIFKGDPNFWLILDNSFAPGSLIKKLVFILNLIDFQKASDKYRLL